MKIFQNLFGMKYIQMVTGIFCVELPNNNEFHSNADMNIFSQHDFQISVTF